MSLTLDPRMYMYVRANAMPNVMFALVELIHNSLDVFRYTEPGDIKIHYDYTGKKLVVVDNAVGVPPSKMVACFATVGKYTAEESSRGFFSRGASDCSALGSVEFISHSVKGSSYLVLNSDTSYTLEAIENPLGKHGLHVTLNVDRYSSMVPVNDIEQIGRYFSLRTYIQGARNVTVTTINSNGDKKVTDALLDNKEFMARNSKDELIESLTLSLSSGKKATLKLYSIKEPDVLLSNTISQRYGLLIHSLNAVHQLSTIHSNIQAHQMVSHIRGDIVMNFIEDEMLNFDKNIVNIPIIDHSRLTGLNQHHPDVKEVNALVYKIMMYHLDKLWRKKEENFDITDLDLDDIFSQDPELAEIMQNVKNTSTTQAIQKDLQKVSSKLSENIRDDDNNNDDNNNDDNNNNIEPPPPQSFLNEDPMSNDMTQQVQDMKLIIHVLEHHHNEEENTITTVHCTDEEQHFQHSWKISDNNFIVTIDGGCHCLSECNGTESKTNVISMLCSDVIVDFIQTKLLPTISATSSTDLLVKIQRIRTKYFELLTTLIHNKLKHTQQVF